MLSYRKATGKLNRFRWQTKGGTPSRTLANIIELEGAKIEDHVRRKASVILDEYGFDTNGIPKNKDVNYGIESEKASISREDILTVANEYNSYQTDKNLIIDDAAIDKYYEVSECTVNVSIDDVGVKEQKETGRSSNKLKKEKRKYVHNTIAHIENCGKKYILNARSTVEMIPLIIAFILYNSLCEKYIQFYVDGARTLQSSILDRFTCFKSFGMILDWYHLKKKCEMELSLALRGSKIRNEYLEKLLPQLWLGKLDVSIQMLQDIPISNLKSGKNTENLVGYFERNRKLIPCYALRAKLGLRNSSNRGEKANDIIVSQRQKHNGMSWSKDGSTALATVTAIHKNKEELNWYKNEVIEFKLGS